MKILFVNGPIKKYIRQMCRCKGARVITCIEPTTNKTEDRGIIQRTITILEDICSDCNVPYKVWYDAGNCILVKNVGEENNEVPKL